MAYRLERACRPGLVHVSGHIQGLLPYGEKLVATKGVEMPAGYRMPSFMWVPPAHQQPHGGTGSMGTAASVPLASVPHGNGRVKRGMSMGGAIKRTSSSTRLSMRTDPLTAPGTPAARSGGHTGYASEDNNIQQNGPGFEFPRSEASDSEYLIPSTWHSSAMAQLDHAQAGHNLKRCSSAGAPQTHLPSSSHDVTHPVSLSGDDAMSVVSYASSAPVSMVTDTSGILPTGSMSAYMPEAAAVVAGQQPGPEIIQKTEFDASGQGSDTLLMELTDAGATGTGDSGAKKIAVRSSGTLDIGHEPTSAGSSTMIASMGSGIAETTIISVGGNSTAGTTAVSGGGNAQHSQVLDVPAAKILHSASINDGGPRPDASGVPAWLVLAATSSLK